MICYFFTSKAMQVYRSRAQTYYLMLPISTRCRFEWLGLWVATTLVMMMMLVAANAFPVVAPNFVVRATTSVITSTAVKRTRPSRNLFHHKAFQTSTNGRAFVLRARRFSDEDNNSKTVDQYGSYEEGDIGISRDEGNAFFSLYYRIYNSNKYRELPSSSKTPLVVLHGGP